jgi:NhaA family Na+:H+ antiporter
MGPGEAELPREPIQRVVEPIERFLHIEAASGAVLVVATLAALILANSPLADGFLGIWATPFGFGASDYEVRHSLQHWINDGVMAIFFFVIGLEVKRELVVGELRDLRRAALPLAAAVGGMVVPAAVYLAFQLGEPAQDGWGIPMATDIAFVVGCLALLGSRVPHTFRVLVLSLAIADDIGAILVIAIGYTDSIDGAALFSGVALIGVVFVLQRLGARSILVYSALGVLIWFAVHESGVHATLAGVILGLMTPARPYLDQSAFARFMRRASEIMHGDWEGEPHRVAKVRGLRRATREVVSPLEYLETILHPWVGFLIMPAFALANAGVPLRLEAFGDPVALSVAAGLLIGKPLGIVLASWLAVRTGLAALPDGVGWGTLIGGGFLAGIGFTMALFIAGLALEGSALAAAKVGILGASVVAAVIGMTILMRKRGDPS